MRADILCEHDLCDLLRPLKGPFVFLETAVFDDRNHRSYLFKDFHQILTFTSQDSPEKFFAQVDRLLEQGFWLSGYFAYEFGYCLEPALIHLITPGYKLLAWLGVSRSPKIIEHHKYIPSGTSSAGSGYDLKMLGSGIGKQEYFSRINEIKKYIREGLTYQVNLTFKEKFALRGEALDLYLGLRQTQPTAYMALINIGKANLLSFSPELFFRMDAGRLTVRPMKGTGSRGSGFAEDRKKAAWLLQDSKIAAENLMIVDLLRNDLGKISEKVRVARLFEVEKYPTIYQLTSTVKSKLKPGVKTWEIFSALFPSGSVTGAPKIKTMEIIKNLESESRGIYTGAIGFLKGKDACFNVAIRTISLAGKDAEMGVGGGIVYDSKSGDEFKEAKLKAKFLLPAERGFSLFESLLWDPVKGYYLLGPHLSWLRKSALYFSFDFDLPRIREKLDAFAKGLKAKPYKVRLELCPDAEIKMSKIILPENPGTVKVKLSLIRNDPKDLFLYHKTTNRKVYDREKASAIADGFFEVIFLNGKGQLAEGAITNIFLEKNGKLFTPPAGCGLLAGVLRGRLIKRGAVEEKILYLDDLKKADKFYIGNSVRGLIKARLEG